MTPYAQPLTKVVIDGHLVCPKAVWPYVYFVSLNERAVTLAQRRNTPSCWCLKATEMLKMGLIEKSHGT